MIVFVVKITFMAIRERTSMTKKLLKPECRRNNFPTIIKRQLTRCVYGWDPLRSIFLFLIKVRLKAWKLLNLTNRETSSIYDCTRPSYLASS